MDRETKIVTEGKANVEIIEGKMTKKDAVFFNPEMKFNRDISVACLRVFRKMTTEKMVICDVLSGSGVRGIRYMLEVPDIELAILNDLNPTAVEIIKRNLDINKVKNAVIEKMDSNVLLSLNKNKFNFIDIDPFGSPAPFIDNAGRAVRHGGFLGVTATDLGPLAGTYPKTCLRRYGAKPIKTDIMHETGVRILAGHIIRTLSKHDKGFMPLLCFSSQHYYRIFGAVKKSRSFADKMLDEVGFLLYCHNCGRMEYSHHNCGRCGCGEEYDYAGPLYTGNLYDADLVDKIESADSIMEKFIEILKEESKVDAMLYDIHEICSRNKIDTMKRDTIINRLKESGYKASKSIFGGLKIRTDAPIGTIVEAIKKRAI
ncbi:MAG: tRNA (guanine(10)-N(2))-dimethyltransferase [archaeon]